MDMKSAIEQVFVVVDKQLRASDDTIENAKAEVSILRNKNIPPDARATLDTIAKIVENVGSGNIKSAKTKCTLKIKDDFDKRIKIHLKIPNKRGNHEDQYPKEPLPDYPQEKHNEYHGRSLQKEDVQRNTYPDHSKVNTANDEEQEILRGQKASQAMRHNNPEIADLSDTNRPTKIAEHFTELYDNEWTSAFEILSEKKKTEEKKITQLLLKIVEEAYSFSKNEAERQIRVMNSALMDILETGEVKRKVQNKDLPKDTGLLLQYRKEHAGRYIERLQNDFDKVVKTICKGVLKEEPAENGVMLKYGRKAVELTWWMCVQEPPVHMVSTKDKFNPDHYRAYTKSGKTLDFFVWPALKLYEGGGIMTKGVVQYK